MNWFQGCEWQHYRTTWQVCRWFLPKTFVSGPTLTGRDESSCLLEEGGGECSRQFNAHFKLAKRVSKGRENILVSFFIAAINVSSNHIQSFLLGISCLSNGFASHHPRVQQFCCHPNSSLIQSPKGHLDTVPHWNPVWKMMDDGKKMETPLYQGHDLTPVHYFHLIYFMILCDIFCDPVL